MFITKLLTFIYVTISTIEALSDNVTIEINERSLAKFLLDDYYKFTRPVRNHSNVLSVTVQPQIYNLVEVNAKNEQIKLLLWFPQGWKDDYLTWNPDEWGGIEKIIIPKSLIWIPDGYIFNTVEEMETLENHNVRVRYDGNVETDFNKLVDLTCPMSVLSFPFDSQLCALQFGSWSYPYYMLSFNVLGATVDEKNNHSEWDIIAFNFTKLVTRYNDTVGGVNVYEEIVFYLEIRRKPLHYILVIIIPTFLIVTVSNIGLFTPHGVHGDREEHVTIIFFHIVSLGLTTMLTMAVILDMVTGEMPKSNEGIPLLGKYVLIEFSISIIAVLISVLIIFAHERMLYLEARPPYWICRIFCKECRAPLAEMEYDDLLSKPLEFKQELRLCIEKVRKYLDDIDSKDRNELIWQRFFSWTDIFCGLFFCVFNCLITFYMFFEYSF
ncbi:CRE-LGC-12 protein [Caenorhabditis remanei]|uniref:CRE-LGC-12 protein n=1 Tax=Caenorhabditis remanei TaxID=31234 RepID=E3MWF7_CAERE|nr:CRE-LGC-12 protein [Caenorhabditis remanei]